MPNFTISTHTVKIGNLEKFGICTNVIKKETFKIKFTNCILLIPKFQKIINSLFNSY